MPRSLSLGFLLFLAAVFTSAQTPAPQRSAPEGTAGAPISVNRRARVRMESSAQRNENVAVYLIDTNAVKESNIRLGTVATLVQEATADTQWFSAEHGRPAAERYLLRPQSFNSWHGDLFWSHQNSIFNARTFFQYGPVKPSRRNFYGGSFTGLLPHKMAISGNFTQRAIRGMVNGNVLVPLQNERTPKATDPATRAIIQSYLNAYPAELPNRPDFDIRALNTNAPQAIDEISGALRLDIPVGPRDKVLLSQTLQRQRIDAFQLVAGQNPDTEIHNLRSSITWNRVLSAATLFQLGASYSRNRSVLISEPNAVGPRVRFGFQIEELGPDSMFPVDRATNSYRYGGALQHSIDGGRHTLYAGGDLIRFQLNGIESGNLRGYFQFTNNFGRTAIENLLQGTPSTYDVAIGELSRGYRTWTGNVYVADRWRVNSRLQLYLGLRYTADGAPSEVHAVEVIPYGCDCNNWSPRISAAFQAGAGWTLRAMYTTTFAQILPVTYQQVRNNPPTVRYVQVQTPNLVDPLAGVNWQDPNARYTPTWLSPDLVSPYSHQYNFSVERRLGGGNFRAGYVGSRSIKLLNSFILNRAEPVPGIPTTQATIDQRRLDPRYYETRTVVNGGLAWFDAGVVQWDAPLRRGLATSISYTFSKALDEGIDFSATAANKDILSQRSQWQYDSFQDRKGLSNFDATHALQAMAIYDVPAAGQGWVRAVTAGWQVTNAVMWKSGTPFTLFIGSDAPGFGNVDGGPSDRPHLLDPSILGLTVGHPDDAPRIISRDRFAYMKPGDHAGNLGRNNFRKSRIWNWNAAVGRQWRWHAPDDWTVQLRAEAYNLSNTPQFDEPQRNLTSPSFGKITNTLNDGRVLQLSFRLLF